MLSLPQEEIVVHGREEFSPAAVDSAGDHRIAMAAAVAAVARTSGLSTITGWGSVATSYPGFAEDLRTVSGVAASVGA
ncbi:hypothetical protein [Nocardiopsis sp. CA-288880]|uniref:hypothetical protein n=1 Tax=Nocardiopsis sp. CA-288880 TaxID=3239995 RepID=UPI003D990F42